MGEEKAPVLSDGDMLEEYPSFNYHGSCFLYCMLFCDFSELSWYVYTSGHMR